MTPDDDQTDDVESVDEEQPTELSVDQLTHAFAQLMGEGGDPQPPTDKDDSEAAVADDEDDSNVTPETILEAILFVGHPNNEPLTSRLMASYLRGVSPSEVDELITDLNTNYRETEAPYEIVSDGPGYRLVLREQWSGVREKFYERIREIRLSQVAIDLLAIVAYHQPVSRKQIDELRDKPSGAVLTQLVRRELLQIERPENSPRTILYRTTDRFLDLFGLQTLEDLPRHDDFQSD